MRIVAFCLVFFLSALTVPVARAANMPGQSCSAFGTTLLSDDHTKIIACLCKEGTSALDGTCIKTGASPTLIWKSQQGGVVTGYEVISQTCNSVASGNGCYVYCPAGKRPVGGGASIGGEGIGASYNTDSSGLYGWVGINKSHDTEDVYVQVICGYVSP